MKLIGMAFFYCVDFVKNCNGDEDINGKNNYGQ